MQIKNTGHHALSDGKDHGPKYADYFPYVLYVLFDGFRILIFEKIQKLEFHFILSLKSMDNILRS